MKKFDVVVVGELNADLILRGLASFPEIGKEIIAEQMKLTMGSSSAILATNIARLGLQVGFMGMIGHDTLGDLVLDTLINRGVDTSGIIINDDVMTGITVVMSYPEDYAMVTYMGAMEKFSIKDVDFQYIFQGRHMHLSSYYLQPNLRAGCLELFKRCKEAGMSTSMDPGWDPDERWEHDIIDVLQYVDVFLPNEQEALNISHKSNLNQALEELNKHASIIVVTQGSKGALLKSKDMYIQTGTYSVKPVDTTGAGDSFNAGFLYQWLNGGNLDKCMIYGSAAGAIATTKMGGATASPNLNELQEFIKKRKQENIIIQNASSPSRNN
ncbi:MAG TPA: carbohydrate kinase family protein [Candidatus Cloacimonas sp.]|jgi:sugar/nucleoside kinase (ribokinase family)|nr:MAG: putative sugar kinase YdjH [Firmicutes bacterium ADurb.Bin080]HRR51693.1 carbohydrate kinase family protein [Candidatus Cloacimonas sp.]